MNATHVIVSALLGSFWAGTAALAMKFRLLPVMPWLIAAVGAVAFAFCLLAFSLCIVRHDCD